MSQVSIIFQWAAVVVAHNWPVLLWLALAAVAAVYTYRRPSRAALSFLYGFAGLAFVFEYRKHLAAHLVKPVDFLLLAELWPLNRAGHVVIEQIVPGLLLVASAGLIVVGVAGRSYSRARPKIGGAAPVKGQAPAAHTRPAESWGALVVGLLVGAAAVRLLSRRG